MPPPTDREIIEATLEALRRVYGMVAAQMLSLDVAEEIRDLWKDEMASMQVAIALGEGKTS